MDTIGQMDNIGDVDYRNYTAMCKYEIPQVCTTAESVNIFLRKEAWRSAVLTETRNKKGDGRFLPAMNCWVFAPEIINEI